MSESASFEAGCTLPLCDGRLPVFGLAAVVINKEGATGAAASGVSWMSVTWTHNASGREWILSQYYLCMALVSPQYILNIRTLIFTCCSQ